MDLDSSVVRNDEKLGVTMFNMDQLVLVVALVVITNLATWIVSTSLAKRRAKQQYGTDNKLGERKARESNTLTQIRWKFYALTAWRENLLAHETSDDNASYLRVVNSNGEVLSSVTCDARQEAITVLNHPSQDFRVFHIRSVENAVRFLVFGE